jgi:uncharacterized UBP type Zn finger protein
MESASCSHLETIAVTEPASAPPACDDCIRTGLSWVHLRLCLECGKVGCCDNSTGRHATAHHDATGHPLIRSLEAGETWSWCYLDEVFL